MLRYIDVNWQEVKLLRSLVKLPTQTFILSLPKTEQTLHNVIQIKLTKASHTPNSPTKRFVTYLPDTQTVPSEHASFPSCPVCSFVENEARFNLHSRPHLPHPCSTPSHPTTPLYTSSHTQQVTLIIVLFTLPGMTFEACVRHLDFSLYFRHVMSRGLSLLHFHAHTLFVNSGTEYKSLKQTTS